MQRRTSGHMVLFSFCNVALCPRLKQTYLVEPDGGLLQAGGFLHETMLMLSIAMSPWYEIPRLPSNSMVNAEERRPIMA